MSEPIQEPQAPLEAAAEEPAWAGPSQEEWQQTQQAIQYLAEMAQNQPQIVMPGQQQDQPQTRPGLDPYDDGFETRLIEYIDQRMQPYSQLHTEIVMGEAQERAQDILTDLAARDGDFNKDMALSLAERLLPEQTARYGPGPRAAEEALQLAAQQVREYEKTVGQSAIDQHLNQLKTLSGAPSEPGSVYAQGVQQRTVPDYRQGGTVTQRFFQRPE